MVARRIQLIAIAGLVGVLFCWSVAVAQQKAKPGSKASLYNGNSLKPDSTPGGPAPVRDVSGSWAGNLVSERGEVPPYTPLGEQLGSRIRPETKYGTGFSNDPMNTCDPLGLPRNLAFETRGLAFATMGPDRIAVLHQYQRIWRYVWMDGRPLPTKFDTEDGVPSRWYGYSSGRWEGDHTLVIDTVGLNPDTWVDKAGYAHSVDMHVEERYERIDHNHLMATITVSDPKIFTKNPFVLARNEYRWIPDQEAEEQLCVPSEMIRYMKIIANPSFHDEPQ
jgi:hypothetical protein